MTGDDDCPGGTRSHDGDDSSEEATKTVGHQADVLHTQEPLGEQAPHMRKAISQFT